MIKEVIEEMKCKHRTIITEKECDAEKNNGNEKIKTRETVVAVLQHES